MTDISLCFYPVAPCASGEIGPVATVDKAIFLHGSTKIVKQSDDVLDCSFDS